MSYRPRHRRRRSSSLPRRVTAGIGVAVTATLLAAGPGAAPSQAASPSQLRHPVANPARYNPYGTVRLAHHGKNVTLTGQVLDRSDPRGPVTLRLWVDGHLRAMLRSNGRTHGFRVTTHLRDGYNHLWIVALNHGSGTANRQLAAFDVTNAASWVSRYHGNRRIAAELVARYGWDASQMRALDAMWFEESNWQTFAANPEGAYGIPQADPGYKMSSAGADWRTNPRTQISWGLRYIKQRYGTPAAAWRSHLRYGSY